MLTICVRLIVIFFQDFGIIYDDDEKLRDDWTKEQWGDFQQDLEISVALTALVLFLYVLAHHNAYPNTLRRGLIDSMAGNHQ